MKLLAALDFLIAPPLREYADHKLLLKSRILVGISVMYGGSMFFTMALLLLFALLDIVVVWPAVISCALSSTCYLFQIVYFRHSGNHLLASTLTLTILSIFTGIFTYVTGGWESPLVFFLFVIPLVAFLVTGYRAGIAWTCLIIAVYGLLGWLHHRGVVAPQVIDRQYAGLLEYFSWVFSWSMIVGGVTLYASTVNTLNISLNSEKEKLRRKATYDEESGIYTRKAFNKLFFSRSQFSHSARTGQSASFALVFVELLPSWELDAHAVKNLMTQLVQAFGSQDGHRITLSRYGKFSITALVSGLGDLPDARKQLLELYRHLEKNLPGKEAELCFGAVVAPEDYKDLEQVITEARSALQNAKRHTPKYLVLSKGERAQQRYDVMARVTVAPFNEIISANPARARR